MNRIDLPPNFENYDQKIKQNIIEYLNQLNPIERKAYAIAKDHLKSSFNIVKSNGFNDWLREKAK
jgi:hypothetical protein